MIHQGIATTTATIPTEAAIETTAATKVTTIEMAIELTLTKPTTTAMAIVAVATTMEAETTMVAAAATGTTTTVLVPTTMAATTTIVVAYKTQIHALCPDMRATLGVAVIKTQTILIDQPGALLPLHQGLLLLVMLMLLSQQSESSLQPLTGRLETHNQVTQWRDELFVSKIPSPMLFSSQC